MIEVLPVSSTELGLKFKYDPILVERAKGIPQRRWDKDKKLWTFRPTLENIEFVQKWFPNAKWDDACATFESEAKERQRQREKVAERKRTGDIDFSVLNGVPFKMEPKTHQKVALILGRDMPSFAYLMDQGTGKTKVIIDDAAHNFREGRINGLLVIAPNSVKTNWVDPDGSGDDEITKHMPPDVPYNAGCWVSNATSKQKKIYEVFKDRQLIGNPGFQLHILVVNVEAIAFDRVEKEIRQFCQKFDVMIVVDESTRIKHRQTDRTQTAIKLRQLCPIARIASGTPIIKSPLNAYSQFKFLDPDIIGYSNYRSFENHFAIKGGYGGYQILTYQNIDELTEAIDKVSYRVLKDDCLDLDPKVYQKRMVPLNSYQLPIYQSMKENAIADIEGLERIEATIVLTKYLRLQQITSGFAPVLNEAGEMLTYQALGKPPPKIEEALNIIDECQGKVIIWCRFIPEIKMMAEALTKEKISYVEFHGAISESDRLDARRAFQSDGEPRVFLGQVQTGGVGITLSKARTVIYLSNTFNTEDRVQSEDRAHRIGTEGSVVYIDLIAPGTVDQHIIRSLREDKKLSDMILKDGIRAWI